MIRTGDCEVLVRTGSCHILVPGSDQKIQTRLSVAEGKTPNPWLVASLENELLCNSKWEVYYVTKLPLLQVVMVVRFTGNLSSNAKDSLDRENKQPVAVQCSGGW